MAKDGSFDPAEMYASIQRGIRETEQRRDRLAAAALVLGNAIKDVGRAEPWDVAPGSAATGDQGENDVTLGSEAHDRFEIIRAEARINILSAADSLLGWGVLLHSETSVMGAVAVARGVFEACTWTAALLDPSVTSDKRLERALTRRLARLNAGRRVPGLLKPSDGEVAEQDSAIIAEIARIKSYAASRGWTVKKGPRTEYLNEPLSIDWLAKNLPEAVGVEDYAWGQASSMGHGEHPEDVAYYVELVSEYGKAYSWLIRMWSTGAWAGPRLLLASFANYTGRSQASAEFAFFQDAFWDAGLIEGH